MRYELDHTEFDPYAKRVYGLLEAQRQKLWDAKYNVGFSDKVSSGVQEFRLQRKVTIQLLADYIGQDESNEFNKLHASLLTLHPSQLVLNYNFREFAGQEIDNHASFLSAIMKRVKDGSIEYNGLDMKRKRELVLRELYELHEKGRPHESFEDLVDIINLDPHELHSILEYLEKKNLIRENNFEYTITLLGISEVEKMNNQQKQETPQQRRYRVLNTIYDLANGSSTAMPLFIEIEEATQIDSDTMTGILKYLSDKRLVELGGEWLHITSLGIDQIERTRNHPEQETPYFPANIFYNTFNAPVTGVQQGNQNTQTNMVNINPEFNDAVTKLVSLIKTSSLTALDKEDYLSDLERIKQLAEREQTPNVIERAQKKVELVKTGLETTDLAIKAAPYLATLWHFFTSVNS